MAELLLAVCFALPVVLVAIVTRRVIRLVQRLQDPEQVRRMLSPDARAAIARAGLDPASFVLKDLQKSEELQRLVVADLRRVFRSSVLGLRVPQPEIGPGPASFRPAPIDPASGSQLRVGLALAILGAAGVAFFILQSQGG